MTLNVELLTILAQFSVREAEFPSAGFGVPAAVGGEQLVPSRGNRPLSSVIPESSSAAEQIEPTASSAAAERPSKQVAQISQELRLNGDRDESDDDQREQKFHLFILRRVVVIRITDSDRLTDALICPRPRRRSHHPRATTVIYM